MLRAAAALAALTALAACASVREDVGGMFSDVEFGILGPSERAQPEPEPPTRLAEAEIERRPVERMLSVELGATRRGRLLVARGEAPRSGWFQPVLRPRREGRPGPDGFVEFDLLAAPPELNGGDAAPVGAPAQRIVTATAQLPEPALAGVAGLRVFALGGPPAAIALTPAEG